MDEWIVTVIIAVFTAVFGYLYGVQKFRHEHMILTYGEILPSFLKAIFNPKEDLDEAAFNKALAHTWLFSSCDVAKKLDKVASIMVGGKDRGDLIAAIKDATISMRDDIHGINPFKSIKGKLQPEDIKHIYTEFIKIKSI